MDNNDFDYFDFTANSNGRQGRDRDISSRRDNRPKRTLDEQDRGSLERRLLDTDKERELFACGKPGHE